MANMTHGVVKKKLFSKKQRFRRKSTTIPKDLFLKDGKKNPPTTVKIPRRGDKNLQCLQKIPQCLQKNLQALQNFTHRILSHSYPSTKHIIVNLFSHPTHSNFHKRKWSYSVKLTEQLHAY